ncbi:MAG: hypothetical protein K0U74_09095 [Alphaproteobacteria bacterium]|nr:hypothetical protein [Alphaproteobacteria bacterium]
MEKIVNDQDRDLSELEIRTFLGNRDLGGPAKDLWDSIRFENCSEQADEKEIVRQFEARKEGIFEASDEFFSRLDAELGSKS